MRRNNQQGLNGQFPSTLFSSERGELLSSLQTLLNHDHARDDSSLASKLQQTEKGAAHKSRPCGFGRFAHIPCDKQEGQSILAQPSTAASIAPPAAQWAAASSAPPLTAGDLPNIKKEMKALEAEVAHQHAEMDADRAEIEKLERLKVRGS